MCRTDTENRYRIDHNYFKDVPAHGKNALKYDNFVVRKKQ